MVRFISAEKTLPLRSEVLREGRPLSACVFPQDIEKGGFHLGYFIEEELIGIASFFLKAHPLAKGIAYQLRGMAIAPNHQGNGFGKKLIDFAKTQLKVTNAQFIWCNARTSAKSFYERLGFEVVSPEFLIEDVGPHYEMLLTLDN
ncbi:MAG: GNAT family N-acetyltransferase [Pedobacter sp.]|nr:MAG: GNAT family N-acetyltransferase [Pedobacter sp.]